MRPTSAVIFEGPSRLDGAPIVVVVTGLGAGSTNRKTGAMLQTYILRADVDPVAAVRSGADASVCGDCPLRATVAGTAQGRGCYVNIGQGPLAVWRAYRAGRYPRRSPFGLGAGRAVRVGTYGDPAAAPASLWHVLTLGARRVTGYTHQWRRPEAAGLRALCMASVETAAQADAAHAAGWRTFRIVAGVAPALGEIECLSDARGIACESCGLCNGAGFDGERARVKSIVIMAHGSGAASARKVVAR